MAVACTIKPVRSVPYDPYKAEDNLVKIVNYDPKVRYKLKHIFTIVHYDHETFMVLAIGLSYRLPLFFLCFFFKAHMQKQQQQGNRQQTSLSSSFSLSRLLSSSSLIRFLSSSLARSFASKRSLSSLIAWNSINILS